LPRYFAKNRAVSRRDLFGHQSEPGAEVAKAKVRRKVPLYSGPKAESAADGPGGQLRGDLTPDRAPEGRPLPSATSCSWKLTSPATASRGIGNRWRFVGCWRFCPLIRDLADAAVAKLPQLPCNQSLSARGGV
jgi:hypothetical protein